MKSSLNKYLILLPVILLLHFPLSSKTEAVIDCSVISKIAGNATQTLAKTSLPYENIPFASLPGKEIQFTHPKSPQKKFKMAFKETKNEDGTGSGKFYAYVETIPNSENETPQVVSLATGLGQTANGTCHIGWLIAVDHQKVLDAATKLQEKLPGTSRIRALKMLQHGNNQELGLQAKLIAEQMEVAIGYKAKLPTTSERESKRLARFGVKPTAEISDADFSAFFQNLNTQKAPPGTTFSIIEQIAKSIPVGTKIEFDVANQETVEALKSNTPWNETLLGRYMAKAGLDLVSISPPTEKGFRQVTLIKKNERPDFFHWN